MAIAHLSTAFPDTLDGLHSFWKTDRKKQLVTNEDDYEMVLVARETGVARFLPVAFLQIASLWSKEDNKLSTKDLATVVHGANQLRRALRTEVAKFLYEPSPPTCLFSNQCLDAKTTFLRTEGWEVWLDDSNLLNDDLLYSTTMTIPGLCKTCQDIMKSSMEKGRLSVWDRLPSYFDLPDWKTLKNTPGTKVSEPSKPDSLYRGFMLSDCSNFSPSNTPAFFSPHMHSNAPQTRFSLGYGQLLKAKEP